MVTWLAKWGSKGGKKVKSILTGGKQKTTGKEVISSVEPKVNKTKLEEAKSKLNIQIQKSKAVTSKLKQTLWESKRKKREERFTFDKRNERTKTIDEKRHEEAQIKKD